MYNNNREITDRFVDQFEADLSVTRLSREIIICSPTEQIKGFFLNISFYFARDG